MDPGEISASRLLVGFNVSCSEARAMRRGSLLPLILFIAMQGFSQHQRARRPCALRLVAEAVQWMISAQMSALSSFSTSVDCANPSICEEWNGWSDELLSFKKQSDVG
jgi:hypothetical protein